MTLKNVHMWALTTQKISKIPPIAIEIFKFTFCFFFGHGKKKKKKLKKFNGTIFLDTIYLQLFEVRTSILDLVYFEYEITKKSKKFVFHKPTNDKNLFFCEKARKLRNLFFFTKIKVRACGVHWNSNFWYRCKFYICDDFPGNIILHVILPCLHIEILSSRITTIKTTKNLVLRILCSNLNSRAFSLENFQQFWFHAFGEKIRSPPSTQLKWLKVWSVLIFEDFQVLKRFDFWRFSSFEAFWFLKHFDFWSVLVFEVI